MVILNKRDRYGWGMIGLHWVVAITVFGMFGLGIWMVDLGYYDTWYKKGPDLHRSIGVLLLGAMLLRLAWRLLNPPPRQEASLSRWERTAGTLVHGCFYMMIVLIACTGYFITTADGRSLQVFDWFAIPAVTLGLDNQEDLAGEVHWYLAVVMMVLVSAHVLAALKHHFVDHDHTLLKMFGKENLDSQ